MLFFYNAKKYYVGYGGHVAARGSHTESSCVRILVRLGFSPGVWWVPMS
jgi:hypothetical protein